jgi:hypothetical protein
MTETATIAVWRPLYTEPVGIVILIVDLIKTDVFKGLGSDVASKGG